MSPVTPAPPKPSPLPVVALPPALAGVLALIDGLLSVLNQTTFDFGTPWKPVVTVILALLAYLGIPALVGPAWQSKLHGILGTAYITVHTILGTLVGAATVALTLIHTSDAVKGAIAGVVSVLAGIGFGPVVAASVKVKSAMTGWGSGKPA